MEQAEEKGMETPQGAENKEAPKPKVMFVDDNKDVDLAWINAEMDNPGLTKNFEVEYLTSAKNLSDAVEKILKTNPEIIFMDSNLVGKFGGPGGSDIIRALREAGYGGIIIGNSTEGAKHFEEKGVAGMMDGFLPDKNEGIKDVLLKNVKSSI